MTDHNDDDDDNDMFRCQATTPSRSRDHNKLRVTQSCVDATTASRYGGTRGGRGDVTVTSSISDDNDDGNWSSASRSNVTRYPQQTVGGTRYSRRRRRRRRRFITINIQSINQSINYEALI